MIRIRMQSFLTRPWAVDWTFIGLVCALWLMNIPMFFNLVRPFHDTNFIFNVFYFFYNDFFFNGDIPGWQPFGRYGVQAALPFLGSLSPSNLLVMLAGWVLRVRDVLFLFKLSLFLEQLVFLYGTYLLSRKIFKHRVTAVFVCLSAALSSVLAIQLWFDFRSYYMLPLIIYFMVRFFSDFRLRHLALSMVLFILSMIGLAPYMSVVLGLELMIIGLVLLVGNYKNLPGIAKTTKWDVIQGAALFVFFISTTLLYYYYSTGSLDLIESLVPGRDPMTKRTGLATFLTYGGNTDFGKFREMFFPVGRFMTRDNTLYFGLIPFIFLFHLFKRFLKPIFLIPVGLAFVGMMYMADYSIAGSSMRYLLPLSFLIFIVYIFKKSKDPVLTALAAVVSVIGLFSVGGKTIVAETIFRYFPMMDYYRHIGLTVANFKLFLPLLAGFGLDAFLANHLGDDKSWKSAKIFKKLEINIASFLALGSIMYVFIAKTMLVSLPYGTEVIYFSLTAAFLTVLFWLRRYLTPKKHFLIFLIACVCFEMFSYQALVNHKLHLSTKLMPLAEGSTLVNRYDFQEIRTLQPLTERSRLITESILLSMRSGQYAQYTMAFNVIQWDPCVSFLRTDYVNLNVAELFRLRGGYVGNLRIILPEDRNLLRSIGCLSPKLKLISDVTFADTVEQTRHIIKNTRNIDEVPVLYGVPENVRTEWESAKADGVGRGAIKVTVFSANELSLDVEIPGTRGSWLYYADAWHPGWKASVNGEPVHVAQANLAFKAVRVPSGKSKISFVFDSTFSRRSSYLFSILGVMFMLIVLGAMVRTALGIKKDKTPEAG